MPNAVSGRYPAAAWEPVSYAGEASLMSGGSLGWVEHVVVGNGDPHDLFEHAPAGNRRFSHLWFAKDGRVRQYQDLRHDSWAQLGGNDSYWSAETEGDPSEALTDAQLDTLAAWHVWSGTADTVAVIPGQPGIATHEMGGAAWGGHRCPGPIRAAQRPEIIRRARILRGGTDMPITPAEIDAIALRTRDMLLAVTYGTRSDGKPHTLGSVWGETLTAAAAAANGVVDVDALAAAVVAKLPPAAAGGLTQADVRLAVAAVLHSAVAQ